MIVFTNINAEKCLIYELKFSRCEVIYIGNIQHILKKRTDVNFSDFIRLFRNGQRSESCAAHFEQQFQPTTSRTDLQK